MSDFRVLWVRMQCRVEKKSHALDNVEYGFAIECIHKLKLKH